MAYEYMQGLGAPQEEQTVQADASVGFTQAQARAEADGIIQALNGLVDRVRAGQAGALQELQQALRHHDIVEIGRSSSPPASSSIAAADWQRLQDALALADAVAAGNDPQNEARMRAGLIALGVVGALGVGAVVLVALLKR